MVCCPVVFVGGGGKTLSSCSWRVWGTKGGVSGTWLGGCRLRGCVYLPRYLRLACRYALWPLRRHLVLGMDVKALSYSYLLDLETRWCSWFRCAHLPTEQVMLYSYPLEVQHWIQLPSRVADGEFSDCWGRA